MKLFLDENISLQVIDDLKNTGFEVEHVRTVGLQGASDKKVAEYAKKQKAILVTKDIEFGSMIIYARGSHYGLIIIRFPHYMKLKDFVRNLISFFNTIEKEKLIGSMIILEIGKYRIRSIS